MATNEYDDIPKGGGGGVKEVDRLTVPVPSSGIEKVKADYRSNYTESDFVLPFESGSSGGTRGFVDATLAAARWAVFTNTAMGTSAPMTAAGVHGLTASGIGHNLIVTAAVANALGGQVTVTLDGNPYVFSASSTGVAGLVAAGLRLYFLDYVASFYNEIATATEVTITGSSGQRVANNGNIADLETQNPDGALIKEGYYLSSNGEWVKYEVVKEVDALSDPVPSSGIEKVIADYRGVYTLDDFNLTLTVGALTTNQILRGYASAAGNTAWSYATQAGGSLEGNAAGVLALGYDGGRSFLMITNAARAVLGDVIQLWLVASSGARLVATVNYLQGEGGNRLYRSENGFSFDAGVGDSIEIRLISANDQALLPTGSFVAVGSEKTGADLVEAGYYFASDGQWERLRGDLPRVITAGAGNTYQLHDRENAIHVEVRRTQGSATMMYPVIILRNELTASNKHFAVDSNNPQNANRSSTVGVSAKINDTGLVTLSVSGWQGKSTIGEVRGLSLGTVLS